MRDEKRLGVVGNLFCAIGALYIVSVNTDVTKGIANGTMCRLVQIHVHNSASVRTKLTETGERIHAVYADEVPCLFFSINYRHLDKLYLLGLFRLAVFPLLLGKKLSNVHSAQQILTLI